MAEAPVPSDPEIAAATFAAHLDRALASPAGERAGWTATRTGPLEAIVHITAERSDGEDTYHLRLRADWYDKWPPQAVFVAPPTGESEEWRIPTGASRWLPKTTSFPDGSFAFHTDYSFSEGPQRQLICCSMSFDYYTTGHTPTPAQHWEQGRHTVAALLNRVQKALRPPYYEGRVGDLDT